MGGELLWIFFMSHWNYSLISLFRHSFLVYKRSHLTLDLLEYLDESKWNSVMIHYFKKKKNELEKRLWLFKRIFFFLKKKAKQNKTKQLVDSFLPPKNMIWKSFYFCLNAKCWTSKWLWKAILSKSIFFFFFFLVF